MNISLVYINPPRDYYYTPLALGYLKSIIIDDGSLRDVSVSIHEFKFEDENDMILSALMHNRPSVIGFSAYVWNLRKVKNICIQIKKRQSDSKSKMHRALKFFPSCFSESITYSRERMDDPSGH